jgi:sugar phosphate isomerase/epimerase
MAFSYAENGHGTICFFRKDSMFKVGLDCYTVRLERFSYEQALNFVVEMGLEGYMVGRPTDLSPTLDHGEIRAQSELAAMKGLYLEVGIPPVNPHVDYWAPKGLSWDDRIRLLKKYIQAAIASGTASLRTLMGGQKDRHNPAVPWAQQVADTVKVMKQLSPLARDAGVRFAFETHCEVTTVELLRMFEAFGEDVGGVCLDTGNLPILLEDPLWATERVARYVVATHTKDAILFTTPTGLAWQARPCGQGQIPLREIFKTVAYYNPNLTLSIEDHEGIFSMPIYDTGWMAHYADLTATELARVVQLAREGDRRLAAGEIPSPTAEDERPWKERMRPRLAASAAYLKCLLAEEGLREVN